ncbi:DUF7660 family protein [Laceyella putida]|uniref:DUF7660 domain-containing protein n=1 Tax=Laceyella putida TaxID=110101 RepID=A0ABW2RMZ5_9BACL
MELADVVEKVSTKEDFLEFVGLLIKDYHKGMDGWENRNVDHYLDALRSWIEDMEGYYEYKNLPVPKDIDWNFFANALMAAKIYE